MNSYVRTKLLEKKKNNGTTSLNIPKNIVDMLSKFEPVNSKKCNYFLEATTNRGMTAFIMGKERISVAENNNNIK